MRRMGVVVLAYLGKPKLGEGGGGGRELPAVRGFGTARDVSALCVV